MTNRHGAFWTESPTSLQPIRDSETVPFVIGSAPIGPTNEPILLTSYQEAVDTFGEENEHTLCEAADVFFRRYGVGPVVFTRVETTEEGDLSTVFQAIDQVDKVYARYQKVVGMLLMPGASSVPGLALAMAAKAESINELWSCVAIIDADSSITNYSEVPAWKQDNNLTDKRMILCWPMVIVGEESQALSTHLAALMLQTDADNEDVPYFSPSNKSLQIQGTMAGGHEVWLDFKEARVLNQAGIVTALNFNSYKAWGNRTAAFPTSTDVKDTFIPIRRMFDWIGNTLVKSFWNRVDFPLRRRTIESIADSANVWLNGLVAQDIILAGKIEYRKEENPYTSIIDGKFKYKVMITPPSPAEEIVFDLEYDPTVLASLFS